MSIMSKKLYEGLITPKQGNKNVFGLVKGDQPQCNKQMKGHKIQCYGMPKKFQGSTAKDFVAFLKVC